MDLSKYRDRVQAECHHIVTALKAQHRRTGFSSALHCSTGVSLEPAKQQASCSDSGDEGTVLDSLMRTILSQNTTDLTSQRAFNSLKMVYPSWEEVRTAPVSSLANAIREGGLADIKAGRMQVLLNTLHEERGSCCLEHLRQLDTADAKAQLLSFKGVGPKTASCVLMFCMKRAEFPVDTHVLHIAKKLSWVPEKTGREAAYTLLNSWLPDALKYDLHILLVQHGKECCRLRGGPLLFTTTLTSTATTTIATSPALQSPHVGPVKVEPLQGHPPIMGASQPSPVPQSPLGGLAKMEPSRGTPSGSGLGSAAAPWVKAASGASVQPSRVTPSGSDLGSAAILWVEAPSGASVKQEPGHAHPATVTVKLESLGDGVEGAPLLGLDGLTKQEALTEAGGSGAGAAEGKLEGPSELAWVGQGLAQRKDEGLEQRQGPEQRPEQTNGPEQGQGPAPSAGRDPVGLVELSVTSMPWAGGCCLKSFYQRRGVSQAPGPKGPDGGTGKAVNKKGIKNGKPAAASKEGLKVEVQAAAKKEKLAAANEEGKPTKKEGKPASKEGGKTEKPAVPCRKRRRGELS